MKNFKINVKDELFSTKEDILEQIVNNYNISYDENEFTIDEIEDVDYIVVKDNILSIHPISAFSIPEGIKEVSIEYLLSNNKSSNLIELI